MSANVIDAQLCARMFLAGAKSLESRKDWINELNVFPVPDGDTGTNMTMTIMSAVNEVNALGEIRMDTLAKAMSSGSLRGARGNSGVILSQLLRGFCKVIRDKSELDTETIVLACQKATETAYKAVMKPKEGTILTVAKGCSTMITEAFEENPDISLEDLLNAGVNRAEEVLAQTPEMLPVLKEAGVVDSGGQGLVQILKGARDSFLGIEPAQEEAAEEQVKEEKKYNYNADFMILLNDGSEKEQEKFLAFMTTMGGGMASVTDNDTMHVHLLTDEPGTAISKAAAIGQLIDIKLENLRKEELMKERTMKAAENEAVKFSEPPKEVGFVAVSIGEGLGNIFRDLGCDVLIEGGQTMNPSTDDVIRAIEKVNAATVFVFPNNKNIILAATQAQSLVKDKKVIVIPTKTIPQGITALINYLPDQSPEENEKAMYEEISLVRTGQLTYAVRDTHIDDKEIHQGDFMGVGDKGILAVGTDLAETAFETVRSMVDDTSELISIYYGDQIPEEDAQVLSDRIAAENPSCEVELNAGGQPIYYYIISVE